MRFFRLRNTPVENLTFAAMMVAFDAILSLIAALLPLSALFIMLLAPLTSAAVSLFCKKRYVLIYLLAAIGICLAVTAWDFLNTLFYMIPAVFTGAFYGLLWKFKLPSSMNIFFTTLLSFLFFYLSLWLIKVMLNADMVAVLLALVGRKTDSGAVTVFPLFALGYSFAQTGIMHGFLLYELKRLGQEETNDEKLAHWYPLIAAIFLISSFVCAFFSAKTGYFFLGLGLYWAIYSTLPLFDDFKPLSLALAVLCLIGGVFLFAGCYSLMPEQSGLLLLNAPALLLMGVTSLHHFLPGPKAKD